MLCSVGVLIVSVATSDLALSHYAQEINFESWLMVTFLDFESKPQIYLEGTAESYHITSLSGLFGISVEDGLTFYGVDDLQFL